MGAKLILKCFNVGNIIILSLNAITIYTILLWERSGSVVVLDSRLMVDRRLLACIETLSLLDVASLA